MNKPGPPPQRLQKPQKPAPAAPASSPAAATASLEDKAVAAIKGAVETRQYLKLAFANPYNLSLFLGALGASALTLNPLLALGAVGLEALWLLHGPDSERLRHILWDPRLSKLRKALEEQDRAGRLQNVSEADRTRVSTLVGRQEQIRTLAAQNPSFTGELLRDELVKTDRLVDAFIEMAVTCSRYEAYLKSVDGNALVKDKARYETAARGVDPGQSAIAQKNLAIVMKRLDKLQEIRRYLGLARGQLDLIENSFQLIADQIVTMQSPQELSGQLNELLDGVEAIRETARDTERVLSSLDGGLSP